MANLLEVEIYNNIYYILISICSLNIHPPVPPLSLYKMYGLLDALVKNIA
jgi:hypothetical protein